MQSKLETPRLSSEQWPCFSEAPNFQATGTLADSPVCGFLLRISRALEDRRAKLKLWKSLQGTLLAADGGDRTFEDMTNLHCDASARLCSMSFGPCKSMGVKEQVPTQAMRLVEETEALRILISSESSLP